MKNCFIFGKVKNQYMKTIKNFNILVACLLSLLANNIFSQCQSTFTYIDQGNGVISFDNSASVGGTSFYWNFDDGTDTIDFNPTHQFTQGAYLVCLTVDDSIQQCTNTYCDSIIIGSVTIPDSCNLTANFTYTLDTNSMGTYVFDANVSGGTSPFTYEWYFDDSTPNSYGQTVTHEYSYDNAYNICLYVVDSNECEVWACDSVEIIGVSSCNIVSGFTYTDNGGGNYSFQSTATGNIGIYSWHFGNSNSSLITPSHSFPIDGTYLVSLYVADSNNFCNNTYSEYITVTGVTNPVACNAAFTIYIDSTYNGVYVVNTSGGNNLSYFWDFGDGNTSNLAYPNYTYSGNGPYELCLTVTSDSNCTSTYCDSIFSGGTVNKGGFEMTVIPPIVTNIHKVSEINDIIIYPNPVINDLYISGSISNVKEVSIFNLNGKKCYSGLYSSSIKISDLTKGIYFLYVAMDDGRQLRFKFIKQ